MEKTKSSIKNKPQKVQDCIDDFLLRIGDKRRYEIKNEADDETTIYLYDVIGEDWYGEGISAENFAEDLENIKSSTIHLRINSPGGDVFDARAMQTALNQHKSKIIAHIDGLAASAATYIMLAADEIEAVEGAIFMIHNAWGLVIGNKNDMIKYAGILAKIDDGVARDYVNKTGQDSKQIEKWMDEETDFNAQEALEYGFIDRIYKPEKQKATKRDAENALRDVGFTASQSKKILADGYKDSEQRDVAEADVNNIGEKELAEAIRLNW